MSEAHDAEHHHRHSLTFSTHENDFEKLTQFQTLFYCPELSVEISYHSVFVVNSRSLKSVAITARDSSHLFFSLSPVGGKKNKRTSQNSS